jgi:hypothetical protein
MFGLKKIKRNKMREFFEVINEYPTTSVLLALLLILIVEQIKKK